MIVRVPGRPMDMPSPGRYVTVPGTGLPSTPIPKAVRSACVKTWPADSKVGASGQWMTVRALVTSK